MTVFFPSDGEEDDNVQKTLNPVPSRRLRNRSSVLDLPVEEENEEVPDPAIDHLEINEEGEEKMQVDFLVWIGADGRRVEVRKGTRGTATYTSSNREYTSVSIEVTKVEAMKGNLRIKFVQQGWNKWNKRKNVTRIDVKEPKTIPADLQFL